MLFAAVRRVRKWHFLRHADRVSLCPLLGEDRKCSAHGQRGAERTQLESMLQAAKFLRLRPGLRVVRFQPLGRIF